MDQTLKYPQVTPTVSTYQAERNPHRSAETDTTRLLYENENKLAHENILRQNLLVKIAQKQQDGNSNSEETVSYTLNENDLRKSINEAKKKNCGGNFPKESVSTSPDMIVLRDESTMDDKTDLELLSQSSVLVYNFPNTVCADYLRTYFTKYGQVG
ncbi:uncharacterized protein LOC115228885 [Octopus sinensis]|nr:uncharacterized protein LOC115228885 [Octopus sinensis]